MGERAILSRRERFDTQILESWKSTRPARRRWPIPPACEVLGGWPPVDGTHRRVRNGTLRRNQLGLQAKCSRNESNRCSRTFQHLRFDHELVCRVGTQEKSGKATARIR